MAKLLRSASLRPLLPLVTALYGGTSRLVWYDDADVEHIMETCDKSHSGEQPPGLRGALAATHTHPTLYASL